MAENNPPFACLNEFGSITLPPGVTVFRADEACNNFYFVQQGSIRVDLTNDEGKAVLLYRIGKNETCVLTTSCLMSHERYSAEAVTETEVVATAIPKAEFEARLNTSQEFRELVFRSFSSRLVTMMAKIDEISFTPLDSRLAQRLVQLSTETLTIAITHEQLANDLGTAREVISRKLNGLEKQGLVNRARGTIEVVSRSGLISRASFRD